MSKRIGISDGWAKAKIKVSELDLKEFKDSYIRAKKRDLKPFEGDYYIGFYEKLSYVVPVAFQGTIALVSDLNGQIINNIYNNDPKYVIKNISLCIFPLKSSSIVMIFVDKDNRRFSRFFKQLRKYDLEEQLSIINYILFSYCEDYFLSPILSKNILDKLIVLSGKTPEMLTISPTTNSQQLEEAKKIFNYGNRSSIPNLLSETYKIHTEIE